MIRIGREIQCLPYAGFFVFFIFLPILWAILVFYAPFLAQQFYSKIWSAQGNQHLESLPPHFLTTSPQNYCTHLQTPIYFNIPVELG